MQQKTLPVNVMYLKINHVTLLFVLITGFLSVWAYDIRLGRFVSLYILCLWGAGATFATSYLARGKFPVPDRIEVMLWLFIFWAAVTITWAPNQSRGVAHLFYYMSSFLIFIIIRRTVVSWMAWRVLGWALIGGALIACVMLLRNAFGDTTAGLVGDRATLGEVNPNFIAYSLATIVPVIIVMGGYEGKFITRLICAVSLTAVFAGLLVSGSRAALAAAFLAVVVSYAATSRKMTWVYGVAMIGILAMVGLLIFEYLPESVRVRLLFFGTVGPGTGELEYLTGRQDVWPIAVETILRKPVTGVGLGSFELTNPTGIAAHNVLLSIGADMGVFAIVMYFGAISALFREVLIRSGHPGVRRAGVGLLIVWFSIAMTGVWDHAVVAWFVFSWFLVGAGGGVEWGQPFRQKPA